MGWGWCVCSSFVRVTNTPSAEGGRQAASTSLIFVLSRCLWYNALMIYFLNPYGSFRYWGQMGSSIFAWITDINVYFRRCNIDQFYNSMSNCATWWFEYPDRGFPNSICNNKSTIELPRSYGETRFREIGNIMELWILQAIATMLYQSGGCYIKPNMNWVWCMHSWDRSRWPRCFSRHKYAEEQFNLLH